MADFFQSGSVATFHRLGDPDVGALEASLVEASAHCPIALVLPCHANELGSEALERIVGQVAEIPYLRQVVVGIDGAGREDWGSAEKIFSRLRQETVLLWNDGPRMKRLTVELAGRGVELGAGGKGRNLWLCYGYVLAGGKARMIATHDCDIKTYSREILARLCYPVAHPTFGFDFCKGYSARFSDRLNGRVMRLLFTPLVRSLESIVGGHPFLSYVDSFRYPLSGEASFDIEVARRAEVPSDWGVEVGFLAEVYRIAAAKSVCQVEICERYDHKHQQLSPQDATKGLNKMAIDVARCIFMAMAGQGIRLDQGIFDTLLTTYQQKAQDTMRCYAADAEINRLRYDRAEEELAVATFARSIRLASRIYLDDPLGHPLIPNWNRVESAHPGVFREILDAAEGDACIF